MRSGANILSRKAFGRRSREEKGSWVDVNLERTRGPDYSMRERAYEDLVIPPALEPGKVGARAAVILPRMAAQSNSVGTSDFDLGTVSEEKNPAYHGVSRAPDQIHDPIDRDGWSMKLPPKGDRYHFPDFLAAPAARAFLNPPPARSKDLLAPGAKVGKARFNLELPDGANIEGIQVTVGMIMPHRELLSSLWRRYVRLELQRIRFAVPLGPVIDIARVDIEGEELDSLVPGPVYRRIVYTTPVERSEVVRWGGLNKVDRTEHAYQLELTVGSYYAPPSGWRFQIPYQSNQGNMVKNVAALVSDGVLRPWLGQTGAPADFGGVEFDTPVQPIETADNAGMGKRYVYFDPVSGSRFEATLIKSNEDLFGASRGAVFFGARVWYD
jgi:hypothetical protein